MAAIQKGSAKDDTAMHLLRCLWFFVAHYDIEPPPQLLPAADTLLGTSPAGNKKRPA